MRVASRRVALTVAPLLVAASASATSYRAKHGDELAATANTSIVALRFHKVGSTSLAAILNAAVGVRGNYMRHESLAAYRQGGLPGLRCLGAPRAPRIIFVVVLREPAARILSALQYYSSLGTFGVLNSGRGGGIDGRALVNPQRGAGDFLAKVRQMYSWLRTTPCSSFTVEAIARHLQLLVSHSTMGETLGAGMLANQYSHYFNVKSSKDVAPALERMRREYIVGITTDMKTLVETIARLLPSHMRDNALRRMMDVMDRLVGSSMSLSQKTAKGTAGTGRTAPKRKLQHHRPSSNYCSATDVRPEVRAGIAQLAGFDAALYDGAVAIAKEQHAVNAGALPCSRFDKTYRSVAECRAGVGLQ
jgi:hypothetical protein